MNAIIPTTPPLSFPKALISFSRVIKDKSNTRALYDLTDALNGRTMAPVYKSFASSGIGQKITADETYYLKAFSDRERLSALPSGTVGRAYQDYLDAEDLSVDGVQAAFEASGAKLPGTLHEDPVAVAFRQTVSLTHDLFHILTGFGRDAVGEIALRQFTAIQNGGRGCRAVCQLAAIKIKSSAPHLPVYQCMDEARAMAKLAEPLLLCDLTEFLALPIDEARCRLGIVPSPTYTSIERNELENLWIASSHNPMSEWHPAEAGAV